MSEATLSRRAPRRFWGWGSADATLDASEKARLKFMLGQLGCLDEPPPVPLLSEISLRAPRVAPPAALAKIFSGAPLDRLNHAYGKSYADCARMWLRNVPNPPDWVVFPDDEQAVVDVLDWAGRSNVAVVPYGGGSSVCGGVEPAVGDSFSGVVSLDLERLSRVLEVDRTSRAARIQAGALGPELEAQLKEHGLTLRHFPQSFEFSTLGGWIATRAAGHFATVHTHIDDFVESTRLVTPAGVLQTRRLPASGAGPADTRLRRDARRGDRGVGSPAGEAAFPRLSLGALRGLPAGRGMRSRALAVGAKPEQLPAAGPDGDDLLGSG
jgi:alkyldihydroxyacetonephosphate synthase